MKSSGNKVLIVDDSRESAEILYDFLKGSGDFEMVGIANDGIKALELIEKEEPDIVILDIIMPKLDGLGVIEKVNSQSMENKPVFIVLSAISEDRIVKRALSLGIGYYFVKPFEIALLADRIRQLFVKKQKLEHSNKAVKNSDTDVKSPELYKGPTPKTGLVNIVTDLLHEIGMPPNIKGYQFIREALMLSVNDYKILDSVTQGIYNSIAEKCGSTPGKVERAIRHAIDVARTRGNADKIQSIFGGTYNTSKSKLTNSYFIATIADKIRLAMESAK